MKPFTDDVWPSSGFRVKSEVVGRLVGSTTVAGEKTFLRRRVSPSNGFRRFLRRRVSLMKPFTDDVWPSSGFRVKSEVAGRLVGSTTVAGEKTSRSVVFPFSGIHGQGSFPDGLAQEDHQARYLLYHIYLL